MEAFLTSETLHLRVDLPGIRREDISLSTSGNMLVLRGTRPYQKPQELGRFLAFERAYGSFERYIPLPMRVTIEALKAKLVGGVLEVKIPLVQEEKHPEKEIQIA